ILAFSRTWRQIDSLRATCFGQKKPDAIGIGFESTPKEEGGGDNLWVDLALRNLRPATLFYRISLCSARKTSFPTRKNTDLAQKQPRYQALTALSRCGFLSRIVNSHARLHDGDATERIMSNQLQWPLPKIARTSWNAQYAGPACPA
ncbi:MAG TPA: hypothetical protein VEH04_04545, partial [Verrucomicrobiae bacterium]|nr:hypothetical protein [Verrucomicrobiae bacterium]